MTASATTALTQQRQQFTTLKDFLETRKSAIAGVAAKHLTPDRLMRIALAAASREEKLLQCSPASILKSVMDCAKLGLEPIGRGGAYLVPYRNRKTGQLEAQLITDYRGEIELVCRTGRVISVRPYVVYENEHFEEHGGSMPRLDHERILDHERRGKAVAAYAVAQMKEGPTDWEVLNVYEIEARRAKSQAKDFGPWKTDVLAMWRKTAIRALTNRMPHSTEYRDYVDREEAIDTGLGPIIDVDVEPEAPESKVEKLKADLKRGRLVPASEEPEATEEG